MGNVGSRRSERSFYPVTLPSCVSRIGGGSFEGHEKKEYAPDSPAADGAHSLPTQTGPAPMQCPNAEFWIAKPARFLHSGSNVLLDPFEHSGWPLAASDSGSPCR